MKKLIQTISTGEWRFVAVLMVVIMFLTGVPFLYGWLSAPAGAVYNGLHALSPGDVPVYYSYITQVAHGDFFVKDLFTSEPQTLGTFNVWWTGVGLLMRWSGLPVELVFQLSRLAMIPVFMVIAYIFIAYFLSDRLQRQASYIFLLFSGGVGAYFSPLIDLFDLGGERLYWWPIDLWLTEANIFNTLFQTSHFIASITLTLSVFLLLLLAFDYHKFLYAVGAGVLLLFYFNFHPYYALPIFATLGVYLLTLFWQSNKILWRNVWYVVVAFALSLPSIIYHVWLIVESPVIARRAAQNVTLISPPIFIILGYGFLWLGLATGLYFWLKHSRRDPKLRFLALYLAVNLALICSPVPFQSRYTQGLQVALAIFTTVGIFGLRDVAFKKLPPKIFDFWVNNPALLGVLFLFLFSSSAIGGVIRDYYYFTYKPGRIESSLYIKKDAFKAMDWLRERNDGGVVLASALSSIFIPAFAGHPIYAAHGHETLFFYSKILYVANFFRSNTDDEFKKKWLTRENIRYIVYGDEEKKLGLFNPAEKEYLTLLFDAGDAQVYGFTGE